MFEGREDDELEDFAAALFLAAILLIRLNIGEACTHSTLAHTRDHTVHRKPGAQEVKC